MHSETSVTSWIAGRWLGGNESNTPCFTVIDTPGIGDTSGKATDCSNFMEVAEMAKKISPIDAFVLVIKGVTTRVGPKLLDQLRFFEELFGERFWKSTVIAVSFWSHGRKDISRRKRNNGGLNERTMATKLQEELKKTFRQVPDVIPTVFVDPVYYEEEAEAHETEVYARETAKLWENMIDSKRFLCDGGCSAESFLQGTPRLEEDVTEGGGIVSQYKTGRVEIKWTVWFGDCDQDGIRSYTVLKDNQTIYEMVEAAYRIDVDWEPGRGTATTLKPPTLQIVDSCNHMKPGSLTQCDNLKSKFKTITLTFDPITDACLGKYKLRNDRGVSQEAELVEIVDAKPLPWSPWGPCSVTCIGDNMEFGEKVRTRSSSPPVNGGKSFTAATRETKMCASATDSDTPILCAGKPGQWSPWGPCSKTCGAGGRRERTRSCDTGRVCPDMKTKDFGDCSVDTSMNDWLPVCPEISVYSKWSDWSCASYCFNPLDRSDTSMTRTRTCKDDTPKHADYNCQTMDKPLKETSRPCTKTPTSYKTRYGQTCLSGHPCDHYSKDYKWCRTGYGNGDWEYCSSDGDSTIYGKTCYSTCARNGESYYWCRTKDSWDYCSPRSGC